MGQMVPGSEISWVQPSACWSRTRHSPSLRSSSARDLQFNFARPRAAASASTPLFLRRLFGLAVFGFVAEGIFGYNVLIGYAVWGVGLLLVWRWSTKALLITVVICAMSLDLYNIAAFTYRRATLEIEGGRRAGADFQAEYRVARETMDQARSQSSFPKLVAARLRFMRSFSAGPFSFTPWNFFVRLLLGLLAVRLGLWRRPRRTPPPHPFRNGIRVPVLGRRPMGPAFTNASNGFPGRKYFWRVLEKPARGVPAVPRRVAGIHLHRGRTTDHRIRPLLGTSPESLCNLRPDGAYQLHDSDILIDVLFRSYGLGLRIRAVLIPFVALALFGALAAFSRWWLQRFRFGPAEWVLRSITYARLNRFDGPNNMPVAGSA